MGIFGFIAYMGIVYSFVRRWFRLRKRMITTADKIPYYALGTAVFAILVNNLTSPVTDSLRPALLLAVLMACLSTLMMDQDRLQSSPAQA
jgi:uncharacterized membrane protein YcaP (DUF421 family)